MIGQKKLMQRFSDMIDADLLPRFIILTGETGSEFSDVAPFIADKLDGVCNTLADIKVDTVRKMIDDAYFQTSTVVYNIPLSDGMSPQAKNALLKVTEEPPNKAYFVMSVEDLDSTLHTILSRATVFRMDNYAQRDLQQYFVDKGGKKSDFSSIGGICHTPGDVDILLEYDIKKFYRYVLSFSENVAKVSGAKSLTLTNDISIKEGDSGYNIRLFLRLFQYICLKENLESGTKAVILATNYMKDLRIKGINQKMLLDNFVLDLRKIWR